MVADVREKSAGVLCVYLDGVDETEVSGKLVTLVFEATNRHGSFSTVTRVGTSANGVRYVNETQNSSGDINADGYLDARDLVRLKKYSSDASIEVDEKNSQIHSCVEIYTDRNVGLLRRKLTR